MRSGGQYELDNCRGTGTEGEQKEEVLVLVQEKRAPGKQTLNNPSI